MDFKQYPYISSAANPHVQAAAALLKSPAERIQANAFLLEGVRLVLDAFCSGRRPLRLFLGAHVGGTQDEKLLRLIDEAEEVYSISPAVAKRLSDTQSPQGVFAVFALPKEEHTESDFFAPGKKMLALELVQDPGNFGGIARTAEALGIGGLCAIGGCDRFNPKALRASMGALLRVPFGTYTNSAAVLSAAKSNHMPCFAAVPNKDATPISAMDFSSGGVLFIGNEGNGLLADTIAACGTKVTIPMRGRSESLNALGAASILLYEMCK